MAGKPLHITVVGAGIVGLWQAVTHAEAGCIVHLVETSEAPFEAAASRFAGAMIAPYCEAESAQPVVQQYGVEAASIWARSGLPLVRNGTLVVAGARDQTELRRFARLTSGHRTIDREELDAFEPDLAGRFSSALLFPDESHMTTPRVLNALLDRVRKLGVEVSFGATWLEGDLDISDVVIDCRGMGARDTLMNLRGVRGERLLIRTGDVKLSRPVRLLHPRHPFYIVPWDEALFLVGATVIESEDDSAMTVRSALELLGLAYALHPAFGEAELLELSAGVRPAFPDNVPRVIVENGGALIRVNGTFRHGYLLSPVLADVVANHLRDDTFAHPLLLRSRAD